MWIKHSLRDGFSFSISSDGINMFKLQLCNEENKVYVDNSRNCASYYDGLWTLGANNYFKKALQSSESYGTCHWENHRYVKKETYISSTNLVAISSGIKTLVHPLLSSCQLSVNATSLILHWFNGAIHNKGA